ncbi:transglycosylase SLT domain-containing protein [Candidatus Poribacteria bacterium]|nr:transglycosylase SLT domain-containing protein [Candidatus Poribacteria bacterium]MYB02376.1 transglycosylase SLT domain-containing protein [Candidatus Poribacteria bacterium]
MIRKRTLIFVIVTIALLLVSSGIINLHLDLRLLALTPKILKYKGLIQKYAAKENLDPRLICALIAQESGFDEKARSAVGAQGLTQLMPKTAKELGVDDPLDAEQNIAGAARHLHTLYHVFPESQPDHQHQLVLASYNAGLGRVRDAQALARHQQKANPLLWEPVRKALSQLTQQHASIHKQVWGSEAPPHGYFEGFNETSNYVKRVMHYYGRLCFYGEVLFFL